MKDYNFNKLKHLACVRVKPERRKVLDCGNTLESSIEAIALAATQFESIY